MSNVYLQSQITELTVRVQKERDELNTANETVMQQVEKLIAENGNLNVNNATLKVQVVKQLVCECRMHKICCP